VSVDRQRLHTRTEPFGHIGAAVCTGVEPPPSVPDPA
jgi:hypothetical protein